jgi:hypothetical protein
MASEPLLELHKQHTAAQDKYTYFLLAAAGAAIGFAVQKTEGMKLSWWLLPVAAAILCWGASFYYGCKNLEWVHTAIRANVTLLQLRAGIHPNQPQHPSLVPVAMSGTGQAFDKSIEKASFFAKWQFRLLVSGGVCFIVWRVAEIVRVSYAP